MKLSEALERTCFIGILRRIPPEKMLYCAETFAAEGGDVLEITFDPADPDTLRKTRRALRKIRRTVPHLHLGAGTVLNVAMAEAATDSGAEFLVSPGTSPAIIEIAHKQGVAAIPGAYTPNELLHAYESGADLVKLFPILPGGELYVRTVMSPLAHIPFLVTGGIHPGNVRSMLETGATAVGAGASLFPPEQVERNNWRGIAQTIRLHWKEIPERKSNGSIN